MAMHTQLCAWMHGRPDGGMHAWMDVHGWMHGWMEGGMEGWLAGWMVAWLDKYDG